MYHHTLLLSGKLMAPCQHIKEMQLYLASHINNSNSFCCILINTAFVALQKMKAQTNKPQDIWDQLQLLLRSVERFLSTLLNIDFCEIRIGCCGKCNGWSCKQPVNLSFKAQTEWFYLCFLLCIKPTQSKKKPKQINKHPTSQWESWPTTKRV